MTPSTIDIAGRSVGNGLAPFVIAELGVNHNGDPDLARRLIDAAADAGADAVKLQTFRAERLTLADAPQAPYQRERAAAESQFHMLRRLELPEGALPALRDHALGRNIAFFSSPFDVESLAMLVALGVPAVKIGSGDLTNLVLLRAAAATGLPIVLSSGMATLAEVDRAMADLRANGDPPVALLQCVSVYPATAEMIDLRAMGTMAARYGVPVGFSDHTVGFGAAVAAVALGAAIVEKHLTLDLSLPGPDHAASLDPPSFQLMVTAIREAYAALGTGTKAPVDEELLIRAVARRSLVTARRVPAGARLAAEDITALRPATGISPLELDAVIGRRAARTLEAGHLLAHTDLDAPEWQSEDAVTSADSG